MFETWRLFFALEYVNDKVILLKQIISIQLQKGKTYVAVVDIGLVPEISRLSKTYKISTIDFLFWQEQKQEEEALHTNYEADALIIK